VPVPTYIGGAMALSWSSKNTASRKVALKTLATRFHKARVKTRYYTPEIHLAAFATPRYLRRAL